MEVPDVTIIVPARNESGHILRTLEAIVAQDFDRPYEVVVADGGSTDDTARLVADFAIRFPLVRLVANPAGGTPHALNVLLREARGRVIVRIDAHTVPPPDYVRRLVDHLDQGRAEAAGGRKRAVGKSPFGRAAALAHNSPWGIGDSKYHYAAEVMYVDHVPFGVYERDRALAVGGWDEELVRNQDYDFDFRYGSTGARLLLDPSVVIDWAVRETPRRLAQQYFEYGWWKYRVTRKLGSTFHRRWFVPPALVGVVLTSAAFAPFSRKARFTAVLAVGSYGAFLIAATASLRDREASTTSRLPLALATLQLSWGAGFLSSAISEVFRDPQRRDVRNG